MSASATLVPIGPQPVDTTQNQIIAKFKITFSGAYSPGSVNGDVLSLTDGRLPTAQSPTLVLIEEAPPAGTAPTGYLFTYAPGSNAANGKIVVQQGGASASNPLAQITQNSAYPGALTGTTYVYALCFFPSF